MEAALVLWYCWFEVWTCYKLGGRPIVPWATSFLMDIISRLAAEIVHTTWSVGGEEERGFVVVAVVCWTASSVFMSNRYALLGKLVLTSQLEYKKCRDNKRRESKYLVQGFLSKFTPVSFLGWFFATWLPKESSLIHRHDFGEKNAPSHQILRIFFSFWNCHI